MLFCDVTSGTDGTCCNAWVAMALDSECWTVEDGEKHWILNHVNGSRVPKINNIVAEIYISWSSDNQQHFNKRFVFLFLYVLSCYSELNSLIIMILTRKRKATHENMICRGDHFYGLHYWDMGNDFHEKFFRNLFESKEMPPCLNTPKNDTRSRHRGSGALCILTQA